MNKTNSVKRLCVENFSKNKRKQYLNLKCKTMSIGHEELEAFYVSLAEVEK